MKKIIIGLLLMLCITGCFAKENCERNTEKNIMYIMMGEIIRFEFEESYDKCVKGDEEYNKNETAIVTKFELINNQAKTTFNNVDFKGKTVADALYTLEETAENNDRDINKVNLYTTSSKDYSSYLSYEVDIKYILQKRLIRF